MMREGRQGMKTSWREEKNGQKEDKLKKKKKMMTSWSKEKNRQRGLIVEDEGKKTRDEDKLQ